MSYIGNTPISVAFLTDTFSGNGSTTAFTMTVAPANTSSILVAVTGVVQDPSTYSVSGTTLTFSGAPPSGTNNISVRYLGIPASGVTTTAYRTVTDTTATASQTSFTIPSYTVGYVDVFRNGVRLAAADFTATTGTTVVLANACTVGDTVTTVSFYVSSVLNAIPATAGSVSDSYIVDVSASKLTGSRTIPKGTMPAGSVLQVVSTTKTDSFSTSATSMTDVTGLSVSITPTTSTSKILVLLTLNFAGQNANAGASYQLVRGATAIAIGDVAGSRPQASGSIAYIADSNSSTALSGSFLDSPATTSSTTYKIQVVPGAAPGAGSCYVNRTQTDGNGTNYYNARTASTITVMEIAA
jgi:hypothetical protein